MTVQCVLDRKQVILRADSSNEIQNVSPGRGSYRCKFFRRCST